MSFELQALGFAIGVLAVRRPDASALKGVNPGALVLAVMDPFGNEKALDGLATHYILTDQRPRADEVFRETLRRFPAGRFSDRAAWRRRGGTRAPGGRRRRVEHGDLPASTRRCHSSLGQGLPIHIYCVRAALQRSERPAVDRVGRRCV